MPIGDRVHADGREYIVTWDGTTPLTRASLRRASSLCEVLAPQPSRLRRLAGLNRRTVARAAEEMRAQTRGWPERRTP